MPPAQEAFVSRDEIARAILATSRCGWVRRLAQRLRVDLDDAIGATAHNAILRASTYRPGRGPLSAWVYRIFMHAIYDLAREQSGHQSRGRPVADADTLPDQRSALPLDTLLAEEGIARLTAFLGAEDELTREVVRLHHFEQRPFHEVAVAVGLSLPAAFRRWSAFLRRARLALQGTDPAGESRGEKEGRRRGS